MRRVTERTWLITVASLLSLLLLSEGCAFTPTFDNRLGAIIEPYRFDIIRWELKAIPSEIGDCVFSWFRTMDDEVDVVNRYFHYADQIKALRTEIEAVKVGGRQGDLASLEAELNKLQEQRAGLDKVVERIIGNKVREALTQEDIFNPLDNYVKLKVSFPPLAFNLGEPPSLLVVSPRDRIESIREILLIPDIAVDEKEAIEAEVDGLGVSSLVVDLGGLAAYPSFVTNDANLRFTLDTVTEEWLHQYLAFKPLGFLYMLDLTGVARNYEIATMNETLAGMVSEEIGDIVYKRYYDEQEPQPERVPGSEFDFNREMREIRRAVDRHLAQGEIEQAEQFMEQKRQFLVSKGYYIRKLNQAYFAFYGAYADEPTSVSPIGVEMKELRQRSDSLKDFLDTVAAMTSSEELSQALQKEDAQE